MSSSARFFLELSYKGTHFHGWQVQPNAVTVQEVLEKALTTVLRGDIATTGCGRTDTGVHATHFFAHFDVSGKQPDALATDGSRLAALNSLNALLPRDIAILAILPVHDSAHARFDALSRSYRYFVHFRKDPFRTETSWLLAKMPDIQAMNEAASALLSYTDFSAFSKSHTQVSTNTCTVLSADWQTVNDGLVFHITANRFLRNMVRAIVGTLLDIGYGKRPPEAIHDVIHNRDRSGAGASVPAAGLHLTEIRYPYLHTAKGNPTHG